MNFDRTPLQELVEEKSRTAVTKYHRCYDNLLYSVAVHERSTKYANALIDEALALCGDPFYKISRRRWSKEAQEFLVKFV